MLRIFAAVGFQIVSVVTAVNCPGSGSWVHASCTVDVLAFESCGKVLREMTARIDGQFKQWHDPHNNGTYKLLGKTAAQVDVLRISGSKSLGGIKYTDKVRFELQMEGPNSCRISGCSESQGTSFKDFS